MIILIVYKRLNVVLSEAVKNHLNMRQNGIVELPAINCNLHDVFLDIKVVHKLIIPV